MGLVSWVKQKTAVEKLEIYICDGFYALDRRQQGASKAHIGPPHGPMRPRHIRPDLVIIGTSGSDNMKAHSTPPVALLSEI